MAEEVKRYNLWTGVTGPAHIEASVTGKYVFASDYDALRAELDAARAALRKYGVHLHDCDLCMAWGDDGVCDCGLEAALGVKPRSDEGAER